MLSIVKQVKSTIAKDGTKLGDFVLLIGKTPMYGRVVEINKRFAGPRHYSVNDGTIKVGEELGSMVTIERVLNIDMTKPKRTSKASTIYSEDYIVVDKDFVNQVFRNLNDMIGYVKVINEQEGLI